MTKKIAFKAQIEFEGEAEQFEQLCEAVEKLPGRVRVTPFGPDGRSMTSPDDDVPDGVWTIPPSTLLETQALERMTKGMKRISLSNKISGGIQQPHLHLEDEAVILDRSRFREFVGLTAQKLAERLPEKLSYSQTVSKINQILNLD